MQPLITLLQPAPCTLGFPQPVCARQNLLCTTFVFCVLPAAVAMAVSLTAAAQSDCVTGTKPVGHSCSPGPATAYLGAKAARGRMARGVNQALGESEEGEIILAPCVGAPFLISRQDKATRTTVRFCRDLRDEHVLAVQIELRVGGRTREVVAGGERCARRV